MASCKKNQCFLREETGPNGAMAKSSVIRLVGTGRHLSTGSNPEQDFRDPMGRCKAHYSIL